MVSAPPKPTGWTPVSAEAVFEVWFGRHWREAYRAVSLPLWATARAAAWRALERWSEWIDTSAREAWLTLDPEGYRRLPDDTRYETTGATFCTCTPGGNGGNQWPPRIG